MRERAPLKIKMEKLNIVDAIVVARAHAKAIMLKADREDDGPLHQLGSELLRGRPAQIERACRQLVEKYEDNVAGSILLGFEL